MSYSPDTNPHIVVSYHYVRDPSPEFSGIYPCSVREFERQIEFLHTTYRIASVPEVYEAAQVGSMEKVCAVTLDDGTKDHYQNAVPILERYSVPALFGIITGVFHGWVPLAHTVHLLLSRFEARELLDRFNRSLKEKYPESYEAWSIPADRPLVGSKRLDFGGDVAEENFKETITKAPPALRDSFVGTILKETGSSEDIFAHEFFMSEEEIQDLVTRGFTVGNHTEHHHALDTLSPDEVSQEVNKPNDFFQKNLGCTPSILSYPYGRSSDEVCAVLSKNGITHAVTVERRSVKEGDNPLLIPRFDTNDIRDYLNHLS